MEVRDLFANTPARLKFLKSEATETAACLLVVQQYALLRPSLRLRVIVDGRTALQTTGGHRADAIAAVHGPAVAREMRLVAAEGVTGAISPPKLSRGNRHPIAVLDLAVDAASVDVNVHPAKREVKFRAEGAVFAALQKAVRATLAGSEAPRLAVSVGALAPAAVSPPARQLTLHEPAAQVGYEPPPMAVAPLRPLGQAGDGYLVAEGPQGIVLIDQHAAHERVLFNRFKARLEMGEALSQPLLLPIVVELDAATMVLLGDQRQALLSLGFEIEAFGPRAARVLAAPVETPPGRLEAAILEVLAGLRERSLDDALASLACHSAVRFGDQLDSAEQRRLIEELESTMPDATCPHGRPTRLVIDWQELKRHFRRNY
jgi:DNA mismatch repair protein MutL